MSTGRIFDIKEFAVHDGPGARMTFFLKGCPLRCLWCHNPEGQSADKELMVRTALCEGCGCCTKNTETEDFRRFGRNPAACPKGLITVCGTDISPDELVSRVLPFRDMLKLSEGGVTFSGGEPLTQGDFLDECLTLLSNHGIHTAVETGGFAPTELFRRIVSLTDYIMMDLKIFDDREHIRATGVSNSLILENARFLKESGKEHIFRTPLIPGYTDSEKNLTALREFSGASPWETLPYNELAGAKYPMVGRKYSLDKE